MREELTDIAFLLEEPVRELVQEWIDNDRSKYEAEHAANWQFYKDLVASENEKFEKLLEEWNLRVKQFHILKQSFQISQF